MIEKKNSIGTIILGWCWLFCFFFTGMWVGNYRADKKTEEQITQAYEEQYKEELDAIYELLSAQAFTLRSNIVEKMPHMPERDQVWFEFFNKSLIERAKEIADEHQ